MIVLVCGGRDYKDAEAVSLELDELPANEVILIQGGARGADRLAKQWAEYNGVPCAEVAANWAFYGKRAGVLRNKAMLKLRPDLVIAFPGGTGTADMIKQAQEAGVEVRQAAS